MTQGAVKNLYLLRQLKVGAVILAIRMEAHQIGHRGIQEVEEGGGQNGNIHMLPLEGEHQGGDALRHRHQLLVVCRTEQTKCAKDGSGI